MSSSEDRPNDDELPPDPFPGDPFADGKGPNGRVSQGSGGVGNTSPTNNSGPTESPFGADGFEALSALGPLGPLVGDFLRMAGSQPGLNWDSARQIAIWSAADGAVEANIDPIQRIRLEEAVRRAEPLVSEATGLAVSRKGIQVVAHTRAGWAAQALADYRPLLEKLAASMRPTGASDQSDPLAGLTGLLAPMMLPVQVGNLLGQLGKTSLGTYDLPIPRAESDQLGFVPVNIASFATDWSLDPDLARTHVCITELTMHAVVRVPHVRAQLLDLLGQYASGFQIDFNQIAEQMGAMGFDPSDPSAMERITNNPGALLGAMESGAQKAARARIDVLLSTIMGYVEYVSAVTGARLLGDNRKVMEGWRRRRLSPQDGEKMAGQMLGISFSQDIYDSGVSFIGGVMQRAGTDGLAALWTTEAHLPTANELAAPGLWLARIGFDS